MKKDRTLADLERERRNAFLNLIGYALAFPAIMFAVVSANPDFELGGALIIVTVILLAITYGAHSLKRLVDANAEIKHYIRRHSFRLEDEYPPQLSGLEI